MSTTPRPALVSDDAILEAFTFGPSIRDAMHGYLSGANMVRDIYEAARAKDAELIQRLVDCLQQIADEGHWTPDMHELLNIAAAAGFTPTEP